MTTVWDYFVPNIYKEEREEREETTQTNVTARYLGFKF